MREHFCSPLLQFEADDKGETFTLVECPSQYFWKLSSIANNALIYPSCIGGTGQLISRLTNDEIDAAM